MNYLYTRGPVREIMRDPGSAGRGTQRQVPPVPRDAASRYLLVITALQTPGFYYID